MITIILGKAEEFARFIHGAPNCPPFEKPLPHSTEGLTVATKDDATRGKMPGLVLTWLVQLPEGGVRRVQCSMTVREFVGIYSALRGRYGPGGPQAHRYVGDESPFINYD